MLLPIYDFLISTEHILDQNLWESRDHGVFLLLNEVLESGNSEKGNKSISCEILEINKGEFQPLELFKLLA